MAKEKACHCKACESGYAIHRYVGESYQAKCRLHPKGWCPFVGCRDNTWMKGFEACPYPSKQAIEQPRAADPSTPNQLKLIDLINEDVVKLDMGELGKVYKVIRGIISGQERPEVILRMAS